MNKGATNDLKDEIECAVSTNTNKTFLLTLQHLNYIFTRKMKGTKVQTFGARAVAGVCMVHGWLLGP